MSTPADDAQAVLAFWFGDGQAARAEWFRKDAAFDAQIGERFGALIEQALRGEQLEWQQSPDPALARIILLDQFTRNVFRDTPRAFAGDALALAAARRMVDAGQDRALSPLRRAFVYLPFEHAEDLAAQDESVRLFTDLAAAATDLADMLDYAHRHHVVIARFGRFPHRNDVLGRTSTPEERAFLEQPGSRF
ncbi:DUF924 family protein [Piscinibacter sp.]|uniref:DUF924 family protein n=1 Tax=Piscinibacter sp. TaxID=1903157 RepID=UPI002CF306C8|nr:DUF924 family protein [Albitalea sp.]HUG21877.1 DUF924 family protein [Albitalea sp.]